MHARPRPPGPPWTTRGPGPPGGGMRAAPAGPGTWAAPAPGPGTWAAAAGGPGGRGLALAAGGRWPAPGGGLLAGPASCACADAANTATRVTSGRTILDRLILSKPHCWRAIGPAMTRPTLLTGFRAMSRYKSARTRHILRRGRKASEPLRIAGAGGTRVLSRRLDHVAIGPARHHAVLHLACGGKIARKPDADRKQHDRDDEPGNRAAAVVAGIGLTVDLGLGSVIARVTSDRSAASTTTMRPASYPAQRRPAGRSSDGASARRGSPAGRSS